MAGGKDQRGALEILIAEDGLQTRQFLSYLLGREFNVFITQAKNGNDVIRQLASSTPHLLILDINMPEKSGIEVLKEIEPKHYKFPILIISGYYTSKEEIMNIVSTSKDRVFFLKKPFEAGELLTEVKKILNLPDKR